MKFLHSYLLKRFLINSKPIKITPVAGSIGTKGMPSTVKYLLKVLKKDKNLGIVVDYGAGIGLLSIPLSQMCEKVISIEYDYSAIQGLKKNIEDNNVKNIEVIFSDNIESIVNYNTVIIDAPVHKGREAILEMLGFAHKGLKEDGKLYFIARRNFGAKWYHKYLKSIFQQVEIMDITGGYRTLLCKDKIATSYNQFIRKVIYNNYEFITKPSVFSRKKIDEGSIKLINFVKKEFNNSESKEKTLAEFGAGYGAIGISLSHIFKRIYMIENNLRAFHLLSSNLAKNRIINAEINLFDDFSMYKDNSIDVFIANPPTHYGGYISDLIIAEGFRLLKKSGKIIIVVYKPSSYKMRMDFVFKNVQIFKDGNYSILISIKK